MMDNATLQAIIGHLNELKTDLKMDINDVKMDINDVKANINDVKMDINDVKADISALETNMKDDISALETKINAGQEELRLEISVFQERIKNVEAGQAEFEEMVTRIVNTRLEDVSSMVEQQTRNLRKDLSRNMEATRDLETQLAALEARPRRAGGNSGGCQRRQGQTA
jgi:chromosome segregation ATPase